MPRKTTKDRAAAEAAAQIARAVYFTAHFRLGPTDKRTVQCDTLEDAKKAAAALTAEHGEFGRKACIYAVTPEGLTFHVPGM